MSLIKQSVQIMLLLVISILPQFVSAQETAAERQVNMPQFGKPAEGDILVAPGEIITFYDPWGTEDIKASNPYNSLSAIVFKPAQPGYAVQMNFETVDLNYFSSNYPLYLNVYDGVIDADNSYNFPSEVYDVGSESNIDPMSGTLLDKLQGTLSNKSYLSSDPTGAISCFFHHRNSNTCKGWVAKISVIKLTEMEVKGCGADYTNIVAEPVKKKAIKLGGFYIDAEGMLNPHILTSVSFQLPVSEALDLKSFKLFSGNAEEFSGETPLEASLSQSGDVYTLTTSTALTAGKNLFSVTADVKADAPFGTKAKLVITKVTTAEAPSGIPGFVAGTPVEIRVPFMVLMGKTHETYTVGADAIQFYDDGGKENKISSKYEGTITFVPSTPGKKIQIDFKSIGLYENAYGTATNDDVAYVYNGKVKSEAALNVQLHNAKPVVVKSMSEDGALTIYLKSVTGDYYIGQGFEAVVSEYTPQPMTVKTVSVTQFAEGTVAAGDTNQPLLNINIETENTMPISAQTFSFNIDGTTNSAALIKATLFYTGKSAEFSAENKVSELVLTGGAKFEISGLDAKLVEGSNNFWLAFDINEKSLTDEIIDAGCNSVTVGGKQIAIANVNPDGNRKVKNEIVSVLGSVEKVVYGTWIFKSEKNPLSYYNGYNPVQGNQITTFIPGNDGKIIEIDFSKFNVYYGTASYDTKAKFEIYSGKGETKELLWALTDAADKNIGPGKILRSKAADGSMTVIFNANTTSSSYTAAGFEAAVREYMPRPMTIDDITATQTSTSIIPVTPSAKNQEIIGFSIKASGNLNPKAVEAVTLDLKGCQDKVEKVYLYATGMSDKMNLTDAVASAVPSADKSELVLELAKPIAVEEGVTYYWVTYDIKADLASDVVMDAALKSVKISGEQVVPAVSDPEGERLMKNIYVMKAGENGEIKIGANSLLFYDEGGVDGGITRGFNGTVTFAPSVPGKVIKLKLNKWNIGGNDKMYVYFGGEKKDKEDLLIKSTKNPDEVLSFSEDGKITLKFYTPSYGSSSGLDGWEIEVSEYELKPLSLGEVKAVSVAERKALRGAAHNMIRFDIEVLGDRGNMTVDGFKFGTAGTANIADITKATVFVTDTVSTFMDLNKFAETAVTENFELNGKYNITLPGVYRFWLQYQLSPEAEMGHKVVAVPKTVVYDGSKEVALPAYAQASATIMKGFSGTYTIGKSETADYADFATAIAAMKDGIDGPVVFEIESGEYEELVTVPEIKGASESNTVTFRSKTGNYDDVTIFHNHYVEPSVPSDLKVASEPGVWTIAGADYVTVEGVTILTLDTTYPAVMRVKFASLHNTVRNCHLMTDLSTSLSGQDISVIELYGRNIAGDNNDYFTVENCVIEGGYRGVAIGASWITTPSFERGARIVGNKFLNQGTRGIYVPGQIAYNISNNEFVNNETTSSFTAIDARSCFGECIITDNSFDLKTPGATAIYTEYIKADPEAPAVISNNEIKMYCQSSGSFYGIKIGSRDLSRNVKFLHNTVRLYGESTASAAMFVNNDTEAEIRNNIFQNEATGYTYRVYSTKYFATLQISNNVIYTEGTNFAYAGENIADYETWLTTSGETASYKEKVQFLSESILEPANAGSLLNAKPTDFVKYDIAGVKRGATPTIGAYEYSAEAAVPAFAEGYPVMKGITHDSAVAEVMINANGSIFALCKLASEQAPSVEEVAASENKLEIRANKSAEIMFDGLTNQTQYKVYYLLKSLRGVASELVAGEIFETVYKPTEVSTFEKVKTTPDSGFDDGTAHFTGFAVETAADAPGVGKHVAKLSDASVVKLTNSDKGIPLTGFFLKAAGSVSMKVTDNAGEVKEYTLSGGENWRFVNLKDKGLIVSITFSTDVDAWIDDFSGNPTNLVAYVPNVKVNENEEVVLNAETWSGVGPYVFKWEDAMHNVVSNEATFTFTAKHTTFYTLTITDAWGNTNQDEVEVKVTGKAYPATFEDVYISGEETFWNGNGQDDNGGSGTFSSMYSGSYKFSVNRHSNLWWSGHACSNITNTNYVGLDDQYNSAAGSGVNNSKNYCVTYIDGFTPQSIDITNAEADTVKGMYITNTAWVKNAILKGDGMSTDKDGFKKGDYFKLNIQGTALDGTIKKIEYYLADYRDADEAEHYLVDTWQWVDLRSMGKIKNLTFTLEGTKSNSYGLTTPTYFCMDDLNGERVITDTPNICVGFNESYQYDMSQLADFDLNLAKVKYVITDPFDTSVAEISVQDNVMTITGKKDMSKTSVIVAITQKGVTQYVRIPVEINSETGVGQNISGSACRIYPIPADDFINVATDMTDYSVEILGTNGASLMYIEGNSGNVTIPLDLSQGVYIVKIAGEEQTIVKRIIVK